jgi:Domain of unknown function (DUF4907)
LAGLSKSATGRSAATTAQVDNKVGQSPNASTNLSYKVINAAQHTYGYDVFTDGTLTIHQTSVPALPGNEGFKTREAATKVALLVIEKIKKGEMPPTVSIDEMTKLSVIK